MIYGTLAFLLSMAFGLGWMARGAYSPIRVSDFEYREPPPFEPAIYIVEDIG